jgi:hypothetical protein
VRIEHPRITRAVEFSGRDERGRVCSTLWIETDVDMSLTRWDPRGQLRPNPDHQELWAVARAFATKHAIGQIMVQVKLQSGGA